MNLDEALQTLIAEGRELLEAMEQALLVIEQQPDDEDTINAIFRAAHTIKGSAGLFGLDVMVKVTHVAESVLDRVRNGRLRVDSDLAGLFLALADHLSAQFDLLDAGDPLETLPAEMDIRQAELIGRFEAVLGSESQPAADLVVERGPDLERIGADGVASDCWHLSLRFGPDTLRNGMDPLAFFRYLSTFGTIRHVEPVLEALPYWAGFDAESCYIGFELSFDTTADKKAVEDAFEFVREDSLVRILPPHSRSLRYLELIQALPEDDYRLGEILVRCGSLTEVELAEMLRLQRESDQTNTPIGQMLIDENLVHPPVVAAALQRQKDGQAQARSAEASLIRVDAGKLDQLINLVGELIIAGAGATVVAERCGNAEVVEANGLLARLVQEVRDSALNLRMVQIGSTFNRFQRVVRDVSRELEKDIRLEISGAETELDKTVVEKIGDPLTHLVRNAVDHGIESAALRAQRGKPAQGTVELDAYHEASSIVIEVGDDGGGLDPQRILAKAIERGIVAEGAVLSESEIFNLIFEPGFSTAATVSNISGRGVGMDVVKRNITALRGTVEIESVLEQGTTIRIRLPLTLAIIDGFQVASGKNAYVIPLEMVEECIELDSVSTSSEAGQDYLNLRGDVLPFVRLRNLFDEPGTPPRRENVVVVSYAGTRAGLVVDQLLGEFQTVIKPLGRMFQGVHGLGGFTILGSGEVALILDVAGLLRMLTRVDSHAVRHDSRALLEAFA